MRKEGRKEILYRNSVTPFHFFTAAAVLDFVDPRIGVGEKCYAVDLFIVSDYVDEGEVIRENACMSNFVKYVDELR